MTMSGREVVLRGREMGFRGRVSGAKGEGVWGGKWGFDTHLSTPTQWKGLHI